MGGMLGLAIVIDHAGDFVGVLPEVTLDELASQLATPARLIAGPSSSANHGEPRATP